MDRNEQDNGDVIIKIKQGIIRGTTACSKFYDKKYYCFFGIPFAKPPVRNLRFKAPEPAEKWDGIRNCTEERDVCPQVSVMDKKQIIGNEDCLYANVFCTDIPKKTNELKPVIVQIHCGGYSWGSSLVKVFGSPEFAMQQDIIYVTFHYRLHVFGFLNLQLPECPGNVGLKDQVMLLRWVRENIRDFGGDPNSVTLYGESSGGASVHLHMLSRMSTGLFHKAIMQGGYALNSSWSYHENPVERAFDYAKFVGFNGNSKRELLRHLKRMDAYALVAASVALRGMDDMKYVGNYVGIPFLPSVECGVDNDAAFLTENPRELYRKPVNSVPLIASLNQNEGLYFMTGKAETFASTFNDRMKFIIKRNLWMFNMDEVTLDLICKKIRNFYFGENGAEGRLHELSYYYTDAWFCELYKAVHSIPEQSNNSAYIYHFVYEGTLNFQKRFYTQPGTQFIKGPTHGDDGCYFMDLSESFDGLITINELTPSDHKVINAMGTYFYNFAKTGNPNEPKSGYPFWNETTTDNPCFLEFDADQRLAKGRINEERFAFWDEILDIIESSRLKN